MPAIALQEFASNKLGQITDIKSKKLSLLEQTESQRFVNREGSASA